MHRTLHLFRIGFFICVAASTAIRCGKSTEEPLVSLVIEKEKAVGVSIRDINLEQDEMSTRLKVQLIKTGERIPVLGDYSQKRGEIFFEPLVPFTRGLRYEILLDDDPIGEIEIPKGNFTAPEVIAVYPSQDTLPENLLKMYIEFSMPMVEGHSLNYITLVRKDRDTLEGTFLNLQPELWNANGTVLTLWLDPGRIKRDLIPNQERGAPLQESERYTLSIRNNWPSKDGLPLAHEYAKEFVTTHRDETSPDIAQWKIVPPAGGTKEPIVILFPSALDYFLIRDGIKIKASGGDFLAGDIVIESEERTVRFIPARPWAKGKFELHAEGRLEDLAGNNLNRPFDRDVEEQMVQDNEFFVKEFEIR